MVMMMLLMMMVAMLLMMMMMLLMMMVTMLLVMMIVVLLMMMMFVWLVITYRRYYVCKFPWRPANWLFNFLKHQRDLDTTATSAQIGVMTPCTKMICVSLKCSVYYFWCYYIVSMYQNLFICYGAVTQFS